MAPLPSAVSTSAWVINEQGSGKPPDPAAAGAAGAALEPGLGVELEQAAKKRTATAVRTRTMRNREGSPVVTFPCDANPVIACSFVSGWCRRNSIAAQRKRRQPKSNGLIGVNVPFNGMKREQFVKVVEEVLDSLPREFRSRIRNVSVLVEDMPPSQPPPQPGLPARLTLGLFHGIPTTKKSVFDLATGPDYVVLYQKNIEAVCSSEAEVREQIRLTVIHELGHYFGMDENQLKDV